MAKRRLRSFSSDADSDCQDKVRKVDAALSPSKITTSSCSKKAEVEGIVRSISMSPVKKGASPAQVFFDGELSDGEQIVRFVGYEKDQFEKLDGYYQSQKPCRLRDCMISEGRTGKLQVVVKSYTSIGDSKTPFEITDSANDGSTTTTLSNILEFDDYERVNVSVLVLKVKDVETVGEKRRQKQEVVVGDETGKVILVLWGDKIGCLEEQKSYFFHRVQVNRYGGKAQLQYPRSGASYEEIHDVECEEIGDCSSPSVSQPALLVGAKVIGVQKFEVQYSCISCKALIESSGSSEHAICGKCNTGQILIDSRVTAKLILQDPMGTRVTVRAYTGVLKMICGNLKESDPITMMDLLTAPQFDAEYNKYHILGTIKRQ